MNVSVAIHETLTELSLVTESQFKRALVHGVDPVPVMHENDVRSRFVQGFAQSHDDAPQRVILLLALSIKQGFSPWGCGKP